MTQVAEARRDDPSSRSLEHGLDVFHTAMEARRVLARPWRRAEAVWERAEAADAKVAAAKQQGLDARGVAQTARAAWAKAIASFEQAQRLESAWGRVRAALEVFGPDGRLDDRPHAEAEIAAARGSRPGQGPQRPDRPAEPDLSGPDAPAVGVGRAPAAVACGDGLAVVAATPPAEALGPDHGGDSSRGA